MARSAHHISSLKSNEIPANLQAGIIALKWSDDIRKPLTPSVVHLSIDTKGYYLICYDKSKNEIKCFDIALIHDTRTGSQVSLPQGIEYFDQMSFGVLDVPLTSKWVTIYYGNTFVVSNDLHVIHFCFQSPTIAREWAEQLFRYGHNPLLRNLSSLECLEKIHSKIINSLIDLNTKTIPVQKLIQFLCKNNRDHIKDTKIHQILEDLKLPNQIDSAIDPDQFTFNKFFRFYIHLMERHEVVKIFDSIDENHRRHISWENMKGFIKKQNDVHVDNYEQKVKDLIRKYTQHDEHSKDKGMSDESFLRYLLSFDNLIIDPTILDLFMDMNKPLTHYFISSSHNTYLTGSQFAGRASVEMYRQVLLTGCRCIELDVVESDKGDEPEIKHIYTPIKPVLFIDVIVAIREYAFKVTSYPLILSIENHCGPKVQTKMAQYFVDVFGENLLTEPLNTHPCQENSPLPSPNDLKYKILIKNKKLHPKPISNQNVRTTLQKPGAISATSSSDQSTDINIDLTDITQINSTNSSDELFRHNQEILERLSALKPYVEEHPRHGFIEDEDFSDDDKITNEINPIAIQTTYREAKATRAMSDLVNYIVPVAFKSFVKAEQNNKSYEMSSFHEDKAHNLIRDHAKEFLAYNQRQLSRIYPRGTRIESSNYNPYLYWSVGCQMAALNYQTLDVPMQLNLSLFSLNGACGYLEKPSALCQTRSSFDPKVGTNIENVVSYQIDMKILSGQFLCQDREPTFVDIHMYGMYGDINKRHEYRMRSKRWNGFQAIYDEMNIDTNEFPIRFPKIILPEMAALRFVVTTEDGGFVGQSFLPIAHLCPGYRHIVLRNQINIPVNSSSLFIFIRRNIYVDAKDQKLVDTLAEPLAVQSSHLINVRNSYDAFSPDMLVRFHDPLINNSGENDRSSVLSNETNWYQKHVIAGSELNNRKVLCKVLALNDIEQREVFEREQINRNKLRRVSTDYQKKIQHEEERFQGYFNLQPSHHNGSIRTSNSQEKRRTINEDIEQIEQQLLKLYSEKFHLQQELEYQHLNEYYSKLEKEIKDDYNKQMNQIHNILKKEKAGVLEHVRFQTKQEKHDIKKKETEKDRIAMLKEESFQKNTKVGESTILMLEDMYEQVMKILQTNLQTNLNQLEEKKSQEVQICCNRYSNQLSELKLQLQREIHSDKYDILQDNSSCQSRMPSASFSTVSHYPSECTTSHQRPRRRTINH